jgi:hypothetical protein
MYLLPSHVLGNFHVCLDSSVNYNSVRVQAKATNLEYNGVSEEASYIEFINNKLKRHA